MQKILIIAEIGHNHNGNINLAFDMILEAKNCGADIVKFQLYDTDKIKKPFQSRYWELKYAQLSKNEASLLAHHCIQEDIELMFSVFDTERVKWCEELNVQCYKIASRSINDTTLLRAIKKTGKPIIASLGMWNKKELPKYKADFLYCVSEYPAYITGLPNFEIYAGFSDHTIGCYWAREAIKKGAKIIEKHFTISKDLPGHNQKGSANPQELKDLVTYARQHERGILF